MRTRTILAATLVIPLLAIGCNRQEQSPTAAAPSVGKQAMAPSSQEKAAPESTPPAAGTPPSSMGAQPAPSTPSAGESSSTPQNEPKKGSNS